MENCSNTLKNTNFRKIAFDFSLEKANPFGMTMIGRNGSIGAYRYGFNGMEKSDEVYNVEGASYTAEYWQYDSRLGRRWEIDPRTYSWQSSYASFNNNPIIFIDPLGLYGTKFRAKAERWIKQKQGYEVGEVYKSGNEYGFAAQSSSGESSHYFGKNVNVSSNEANDKYELAILEGKYVYTKNYGWVDMTHAFSKSNRENVGAQNLWQQTRDNNGNIVVSGSVVTYRQDASVSVFTPGIEHSYLVESGLTLEKKREVAVAIMQDVSYDFESLQSLAFWSGSSFEPSDLPSNMLGLYSAMFPELTQEEIMKLIEPLTPEQSLHVYRMYPGTFTDSKYKNYSFSPVFFPNQYSPISPVCPYKLRSVKAADIGKKGSGVIKPYNYMPNAWGNQGPLMNYPILNN